MVDDVSTFLRHLDAVGISGSERVTRGWPHIGAVLADAALQPGRKYEKQVRRRVHGLMSAWPDAATTRGLLARLVRDDLAQALNWNGPRRVGKVEPMARVLEKHGVNDVTEFREALQDSTRRTPLRADLGQVWGVGRKTLNYLHILVGDNDVVAIDSQITSVARDAGITSLSVAHLEHVVTEAARQRGWRPGDLDAAIWQYTQA